MAGSILLIALAALCVVQAHPPWKDHHEPEPPAEEPSCPEPPPKTWVFGYDVPWDTRQYIDSNGDFVGLSKELVQAVCDEAEVDCEHVVAPAIRCWNTETLTGTGINDRWYDACAMFYRTDERDQVFDYSGEFYQARPGVFWRKAGTLTDVANIASLSVAVLTGWAYSETCLEDKNGLSIGTLATLDYSVALSQLAAGTIDLVFTADGLWDSESGVEQISGEDLPCLRGNAGIMHRVDSRISEWFLPAYTTLRSNGVLTNICATYGSITDCV